MIIISKLMAHLFYWLSCAKYPIIVFLPFYRRPLSLDQAKVTRMFWNILAKQAFRTDQPLPFTIIKGDCYECGKTIYRA